MNILRTSIRSVYRHSASGFLRWHPPQSALTSSTADLLQRAIRGLIPGTKRIVLDLAEVSYIDSSGLGAVVSVYLAASRAQCVLELANLQPRIRDLFELSRLQAVFESHRG